MSASLEKEVVVVAKKVCKLAAKKAPVPLLQGNSEDPPPPKAKRALKGAPKEAKVSAAKAKVPLK